MLLTFAASRLEAWKMKTASGSPCASRARVPLIEKLPLTEA